MSTNHRDKARSLIAAAQRTSSNPEMRELADSISTELSRKLAEVVAEGLLPAEERTALAEKRKAVAERFGDVVAKALPRAALDELHKQISGTGEPVTNANQQTGVPDPEEYFGTRVVTRTTPWSDDGRAPDPAAHFAQ